MRSSNERMFDQPMSYQNDAVGVTGWIKCLTTSKHCRAGGRTPVPPGREALRMLRGLMLGRVKIFWARADVWRLLFKATTKEKKSLEN